MAPPSVTALIDELQANPVLVVHCKAFVAVSQEPTANAVGTAVPDVAFARTVLVACVANLASVTALLAILRARDPAEFVTSPV